MGMVLLSDEVRETNTFGRNKKVFLKTLNQNVWQDFLSEFNQKVEKKVKMDEIKEELRDTVVGFEEPVFMATGLDEKGRRELLGKMIRLRETKPSAESVSCKDSSTLSEKIKNKKVKNKIDIKNKPSIIIKDIIIPKTREGGGKSRMRKT